MVRTVLAPIADKSSSENRTDSWRVQTPTIDYSTCIRCMICWKFCPDDAIWATTEDLESPNDRISKMDAPVIDYEHCKGCGICAYECPEHSIEMNIGGSIQ